MTQDKLLFIIYLNAVYTVSDKTLYAVASRQQRMNSNIVVIWKIKRV